MKLKRVVLALVFLFVALSFPGAGECRAAADYLFVNGKVYTMEPRVPWAQAVAVAKDKIVAVGKNRSIRKWAGPKTQVIDLKGRMLMPGFIDGHNHFLAGAFAKRGVRLNGSRDKVELLSRIGDYVRANPNRALYIGYGWTYPMMGGQKGTRQELDAISADKPVVLFNDDAHSIWFNTKAMEMGGITPSTLDPGPSVGFTRDPDGTPAGIAAEAEAWGNIALATGIFGGKEMLKDIVGEIFPMLPRAGITAAHDMGIFAPDLTKGYLGLDLLMEMEKAGALPCRFTGVYGVRDAGLDARRHVAALKAWSQKYSSPMVQITGLKIWADGTPDTHTAVQLEPYADQPDTKGESGWTTPVLAQWIELAYAEGFDVHIHAIGDGSVRRSLDAFESVQKKRGAEGRRSAIHHLDIIHPDDLARFKKLGIGGNATLEWLIRDWHDALELFGEAKRSKEYDIWKRLIRMGVNVSFGSDIPGTDPDELAPLYQMQIVTTGRVPGARVKPVPPTDRIPSLAQMIYGYTMAGAKQMRMEDRIGSIRKGKQADLIVLEKNLFAVPPGELSGTKVLMTLVNGRIVHQEEGLIK
jgi:predicted amidohydrolase YtcJ